MKFSLALHGILRHTYEPWLAQVVVLRFRFGQSLARPSNLRALGMHMMESGEIGV